MMENEDFWIIDPAPQAVEQYLPSGEVTPPFSPTSLEDFALCGRRAAFRHAHILPGRTFPRTRLGTTFHKTVEDIHRHAVEWCDFSPRELRKRAREMFQAIVTEQRQQASQSPRERNLPWPEEFESELCIHVMGAANELNASFRLGETALSGGIVPAEEKVHLITLLVRIEAKIASADGLLSGRADEIRFSKDGIEIIDYKTNNFRQEETLLRYRRQCLLYAALIQEREGVWPVRFRLQGVAPDDFLEETIVSAEALQVADEARYAAHELTGKRWIELPAAPGQECTRCSYRPWCPEYWRTLPYSQTEGRCDFEAIITDVYWRSGAEHASLSLLIPKSHETATLRFSVSLFPHLIKCRMGLTYRFLDARRLPEEASIELQRFSEAYAVAVK